MNILLVLVPLGYLAHMLNWPSSARFLLVHPLPSPRRLCPFLKRSHVCRATSKPASLSHLQSQCQYIKIFDQDILFRLSEGSLQLKASAITVTRSVKVVHWLQNFGALVPLALLLGAVTEDLALRFGDVIGGSQRNTVQPWKPAWGGAWSQDCAQVPCRLSQLLVFP